MMTTPDLISKAHAIDPYPSQQNPNSSWVNARGAWFTNFIIYVALRAAFSVVPGISNELAWTLTNVTYYFGHFILFHWLTGTPFNEDQGEFDGLTLWEQMDNGQQFTPTKKFLTALPIMLFLISTHYSHYDALLFTANMIPLMIVCIAKMPIMHRVRFFGINKTD